MRTLQKLTGYLVVVSVTAVLSNLYITKILIPILVPMHMAMITAIATIGMLCILMQTSIWGTKLVQTVVDSLWEERSCAVVYAIASIIAIIVVESITALGVIGVLIMAAGIYQDDLHAGLIGILIAAIAIIAITGIVAMANDHNTDDEPKEEE